MMPNLNSKLLKVSEPFFISYRELRRLHKLAFFAQQRGHLEVCGVIILDRSSRISLRFIKNLSKHSCNYKISSYYITKIKREYLKNSQIIFGTFHSHPISEATPSLGDIESGFFNNIELIYDVCGCEARLWHKQQKKKNTFKIKEIPIIFQ